MERSVRFSTILFAVILSPAILQTSTCNFRTGNPSLSLLELEAAGQDRVIAFAFSNRTYEVWVPDSEDTVIVRAQSVEPGAQLSLHYQGVVQQIGIGSGEVSVSVSLGSSAIVVFVEAQGGAIDSYWLNVTRDVAPAPCNGGLPQARAVTVGCMTQFTDDQWILPFVLNVNAGSIMGGQPFTAELGGLAVVEEWILDVYQAPIIYGGSTQLKLADVVATVQVRSGATGPDVALQLDMSALVPGPTSFCELLGLSYTCDPANDVDPTDPSFGNTDCEPVGSFNVCRSANLVDVPVLDGTPNSAGGCTQAPIGTPVPDCNCSACAARDPAGCTSGVDCIKEDQCLRNGFCAAGPLYVPLATQTAAYVADATGGQVLWGWADQGVPGLVLCPDSSEPRCASSGGTIPDGTYALPVGAFLDPAGPIGARIENGGLFATQQCAMATQSITNPGVPIPNVVEPTPDRNLIACPIH